MQLPQKDCSGTASLLDRVVQPESHQRSQSSQHIINPSASIIGKYLSALRRDSIIFIRCLLTVTNGQASSHVTHTSFLAACFLKAALGFDFFNTGFVWLLFEFCLPFRFSLAFLYSSFLSSSCFTFFIASASAFSNSYPFSSSSSSMSVMHTGLLFSASFLLRLPSCLSRFRQNQQLRADVLQFPYAEDNL